MVIGIIGAGASGMAAAIAASQNKNASVLLFERQSRVGKKLLATGNGRCNLTNVSAEAAFYHGDNEDFVCYALERLDVENTLDWFRELGLYTVTEESGRVYPYSDQANSVVDILRFALEKENIQLISGFEAEKVRKCGQGFVISGRDGQYRCDKVIIACGGLAGTKLGGSMAGYKLLKSLGHHITRLRPSLVQLRSSWSGCGALKGVRANCKAEIHHNGIFQRGSLGEIQFTQYGISGPVVFDISRDVCNSPGEWTCVLDFLPSMAELRLVSLLRERRKANWNIQELFTGILHNRLGRVLTLGAGIGSQRQAESLTDQEVFALARMVKALEITLTEPMGMDCAQVTAGGAVTNEFDDHTMESKLVPGLYACGEVLDVDGDCGGFNLQWAWSSGRLAGAGAAEVQP